MKRHVVCLHAAASGPQTWTEVGGRLAERGVTVHALTLLGHGRPRRPPGRSATQFRDDVIDQIERLELSRFTLVGHSFGAYVAVLVAPLVAARLDRLVLEEVPAPPRSPADDGLSRIPLPVIALAALNGRTSYPQMRTIVDLLRVPQPSWWETVARIEAPALILAGGTSSHLDQRRLWAVAEAFPQNAHAVTVPVGHHIHRRAPQAWVAAFGARGT